MSSPTSRRPPVNMRPNTAWGDDRGRAAKEPTNENTTRRPLTGAAENNRGSSVIVTLGQPGSPDQIFNSVVQTPRNGGSDAEVMSVTLGVDLLGINNNAVLITQTKIRPYALLEWGIGGANFTAVCDWPTVGTTITLCASTLKVGLRVSSENASPDEVKVNFSAGLAYGTPVGRPTTPAHYTHHIGDLDAGKALVDSSDLITIPAFANSFTVVDNLSSQLTTYIASLYEDNNDSTTGTRFMVQPIKDQTVNLGLNAYPIPHGCKSMRLVNMGLADATGVKIIFNLSF